MPQATGLDYRIQYTQWHTVENGRHTQNGVGTMRVGVAKKNLFQIGHGRIAFYEHGGKTGRAMIKYPPYKKNAQRKNTLVYPGLTTVSLDRIITYMPYYYVLARKGSECHRYYVQLDPESADVLHDVLVSRYDLVQVCAVPYSSVEPDIVISPAP